MRGEPEAIDERAWRAFTGTFAWPTLLLLPAVFALHGLGWLGCLRWGWSPWVGALLNTVAAYLAFTVHHEAAHGNIDGRKGGSGLADEVCGWLSGVFLLAPFPAVRVLHLRHHGVTNDPETDPDMWVAAQGPVRLALRCVTILPHYYWQFLFGPTRQTKSAREALPAALVGMLGLLALLAATLWAGVGGWALWLWVGPAFAATGLLAFAFDWLPHVPFKSRERFLNTRIIESRALAWVLLAQNYHLIHHLYPRVPFYRYVACFERMRPLLERRGSPIQRL